MNHMRESYEGSCLVAPPPSYDGSVYQTKKRVVWCSVASSPDMTNLIAGFFKLDGKP